MPRPKHKIPSHEGMHPPAGPDPADTGFIRELIQQTNRFSGNKFLPGDWIDLGLTCPGFTIPPVRLHIINSPAPRVVLGEDVDKIDDERDHLICTVILHPCNDTARVHPRARTIQVDGLVNRGRSPCVFSLALNDPLAKFVAFNEESGHILLTVDLREPHGGLPQSIFLRESLFHANGKTTTFLQDVWDAYQYAPVYEGVVYEDYAIDQDLHEWLSVLIKEFADKEPVEWRPRTNMCMRDVVDPSLYPYVYDVSRLSRDGRGVLQGIKKFNNETANDTGLDRWGRTFEASVYQWLPTTLIITKTGRVKMEGYINNICRATYPDLYDALSRLLEIFIPRFELVYAYLQELRFTDSEGALAMEQVYRPDLKGAMLRGRKLCVITKITDYVLRNESIEDNFHVQGVSSEHIIMTGMYIVDRDEGFGGGKLEFRRLFLDFEESAICEFLVQARHWRADQIVDDGTRPLGSLSAPKGRLIVFPNCHIHKFSPMLHLTSTGNKNSVMRIVIFFVVDPERDVISSSEVPRQQGTTMTHHEAQEHKLKMVAERESTQTFRTGLEKL